MKLVRPDGVVLDLDKWTIGDCEIVYDEFENQEELAKVLFEKTGILVAGMKGGERNG